MVRNVIYLVKFVLASLGVKDGRLIAIVAKMTGCNETVSPFGGGEFSPHHQKI
jgi:hypothetical protein